MSRASEPSGNERSDGVSQVRREPPVPEGRRESTLPKASGLEDSYERSRRPVRFSTDAPRGAVRAGRNPEAAVREALEARDAAPVRAEGRGRQEARDEKIDPYASLYRGAYDGERLDDRALERVFGRSQRSIERAVDRLRIRPDDISRAREIGLIDGLEAQRLANRSLDALEAAGISDLPKEIRYTHPGPFYFEVDKDDAATLRELKTAIGLDPDRRASQRSNPEDNSWDFDALERMKEEGRLDIVDRFGQPVDIFSTTPIDGREERLVNPKVKYRSLDYEPSETHGDEKRRYALNGDKVMIEAWNHDLSRPDPGMIYEVAAYESPRFNDGRSVDIHSDDTSLWRFETLEEPGSDGRGRMGHVSGEVNLISRNREQIEARLTEEQGRSPSEAEVDAAVAAHNRKKGWARHQGMEYLRYTDDQTPAGNEAMIRAGFRDPDQDGPYWKSENRYNGGHVIAASLGGFGEGLNVTAQAEGNNQDRFAQVEVSDPDKGVTTLRMNESWHDWERHLHNLTELEANNQGLTISQLEEQGFKIPAEIRERYGDDTPLRFEVETSIRSWYEDEGSEMEDPQTRHTREFARFTGTRLVHRQTGEVLGELLMANYNLGSSDEHFGEKIQLLFDEGLLDRDGGYRDNADMGALDGLSKPPPDVSGAGTLSELLPTTSHLRSLMEAERFRELWGPKRRD